MALMFAGVPSPDAFGDMGYWESRYLATELMKREERNMEFQLELCKAQMKASGARF
jgi:hypothetical protein